MKLYDMKQAILFRYMKYVFNQKQREKFYSKIYRLSDDQIGLSFSIILMELKNQEFESSKGRKTPLYLVYEKMEERAALGASISESMDGFIPPVDKAMISSFEGDDISVGFGNLVEYNLKTKEMNGALGKALAYPAFLLSFVVLILGYFSVSIIPLLVENIPPSSYSSLSASSAGLIAVSNGFWIWLPTLIITIITLLVVLSWALPNYNGKFRIYLENIPPFNVYRIVNGCGFLNSLSALSKSGYQEIDALEEISNIASPYLKLRIGLIVDKMKEGENIGQALVNIGMNFPDKEMLKDMAVVSKYGALEESLDTMARNMTQDGLTTIRHQSAFIKQLATMVLAGVIGFIFMGMYSISSDISTIAEQQSGQNNQN